MEFIETPVFTRLMTRLMSDDEYSELQQTLVDNPEAGDIIKAGGGIRKVRFALEGRGKSGGVRVIYYWRKNAYEIYLLLIYPKSKKDNLTDKEVDVLRKIVQEL
ncbi:hypothetical protein AGMMS49545_01000 [Betaproteobacteria bacterium]|nr:hypothetical protein AGMMS49545_01000 [Betaproteobacteria bacterium]